MILLLDASSLINLLNGGVAAVAFQLESFRFSIGPQVFDECKNHRQAIEDLMQESLYMLSDADVSAKIFFALLQQHDLGMGETECLALALQNAGQVCTDDRRARAMCSETLGPERVFGSAKLLRLCVIGGLLLPAKALAAYELMRTKGDFFLKYRFNSLTVNNTRVSGPVITLTHLPELLRLTQFHGHRHSTKRHIF